MSKQTAVEWLVETFKLTNVDLSHHKLLIDQAKVMEAHQIIDFTNDFIDKHTFGDYDGLVQRNKPAEQYYNEQFKNQRS